MLGLGLPALATWQALKGWSPLALWPTGTEPGMWIDPSNLTSQWQDSAGTTPVSTPGTVADSSNPVGLALDLRLGAPTTLGPELVVNGDFSNGTTGWTPGILQGIPANITLTADTTIFPSGGMKISAADYPAAGQTLSGLTVGKWYEASCSIYSDSLRASILVGSSIYSTQESLHRVSRTNEVENLSCFFVATSATMTVWCAKVEENVGWQSGDLYVSNISVREVPGTHLLQSTSTARPLLSARVNLLTYTEDFFGWRNFNSGMTVTTGQTDPDGGTTAVLLKPTAASNWHGFDRPNYFSSIGDNTFRVYIKPDGLQYFFAITGSAQTNEIGTLGACFDLTGAGSVVRVGSWNASATVELDSSGYYICTINSTQTSGGIAFGASNSTTWGEFTGDGTSGFYFAFPDLRRTGSAATQPLYQSVPGNGSTYDATAITPFQLYDGVDDGMATASFAAGTLSNAMDCMIAVRRGSSADMIVGLSNKNTVGYFGVIMDWVGSMPSWIDCGTPSVYVNGAAIGTTRDDLDAAVPVGEWRIVEYRNLDLSAWVGVDFGAAIFGQGAGTVFNGAQGGILLFPSSTSAANRDAARTWLGAKVGLTL